MARLFAVLVLIASTTPIAHAQDPIPAPEPTIAPDEQEIAEVAPDPTPQPPQVDKPSGTVGYTVWDRLAVCESRGNWHINTGNGYYGGLQEDMTFWRNYGGGAARPDLASREQQIAAAERGLAAQGWGAWPACSRILGLR